MRRGLPRAIRTLPQPLSSAHLLAAFNTAPTGPLLPGHDLSRQERWCHSPRANVKLDAPFLLLPIALAVAACNVRPPAVGPDEEALREQPWRREVMVWPVR